MPGSTYDPTADGEKPDEKEPDEGVDRREEASNPLLYAPGPHSFYVIALSWLE